MVEVVPFPEIMHSRDLEMLHPDMLERVQRMLLALKAVDSPLEVFEAWRSPRRQRDVYRSGQGRTRADAWMSAHQYGLAVDFAKPKGRSWTWEVEQRHWAYLQVVAKGVGLVVPSPGWDPWHVEHPKFLEFNRVLKTFRD